MGKEGKVDVLSVLIASTLIFVVYAVLVLGEAFVVQEFPVTGTNASATQGIADTTTPSMQAFNATLGLFQCNVTSNATAGAEPPSLNISNVSLFIQKGSAGTRETAVRNATINSTGDSHVTVNANGTVGIQIINFTNETTMNSFDEGTYFWFCEIMTNASYTTGDSVQVNFTSVNRSFIIDKTSPGFTNLTNTSDAAVATEDTVYISANFSDQLTSIHTVRLFVNVSGLANNEVNITTDGTKGAGNAGNNTQVNLSYKIAGNLTGHVLNFTLQANDSVNNINITPAIIYLVESDGTVPGPINLSNPINLFNTSSAGALQFNFSAVDNNDTNFNCDINISRDGLVFESIAGLNVTSGVHHLNSSTTTFSDGTYSWSVNCTDGVGNFNTSNQVNNFTVDQIPPIFDYYNFTHNTTWDANKGHDQLPELGLGDGISTAQGRTFYSVANWTDNLTQPLQGRFQFYNTTSNSWQTLNNSVAPYLAFNNGSWTNFSFPIPVGRNEFEGRNVSFRIIANDTVGNVNNSASVKNFTIQINDTYAPTITINGTIAVNGTNITNTRPLVSWAVDENSKLTSINVSVDGTIDPGKGVESNCKKYAFFDTTAGANNVEKFRNFSFQIVDDSACTLGNGSHYIEVNAKDIWGNQEVVFHNFTVETGLPTITLSSIDSSSFAAVNGTNVTSSTGINFSVTDGGAGQIKNLSFTSSCNSTGGTFTNLSFIKPFGGTCVGAQANRTVTVTTYDFAENTVTNIFQFLVDDIGPSIAVQSPTEGVRTTNNVSLNWSVVDNNLKISFVGYFLDGKAVNPLNFSATGQSAASTTFSDFRNLNFTPGTHTIKFTANDTLGNVVNSSVITFAVDGPIEFLNINASLEGNLTAYYNSNISNISIRQKTDEGNYSDITVVNDSSNTYEILYQINGTTNVTLTEINGSAANWDKLNIVPVINDTRTAAGIQNNWTNTILRSVVFNNSLEEFITNNNSYHGVVLLPLNISGNVSTAQEFWWIKDGDTLTTRENISQCTAAFTAITTSPCWNYTSNGRTVIQVPHFSVVAVVNDTTAPTITVNTPSSAEGNQTVSMFVSNVTVSTDTVNCKYSINTTEGTTNKSMTKTGTTCMGNTERFKNQDGIYNFTFYATDASNNIGVQVFNLNVSDNTAPDNGLITVQSTDETTANIKITGANESVNATVMIANGSSIIGNQEDFNVTQSVSITGLSAGITYFYNVTVCDFNGNCKINSTVSSFTTDTAAAAAAAAESTGGGGGAASVNNVVASKAQVWSTIPAGSSVSLNIDKATIALTSIAVNNVKAELKSVDLEVQSLKTKPVTAAAAAKVFQYLKINKKKIADGDAETITMGFRVTKSWLTENNLASGDIRLYRYESGIWNRLVTKVTGTDDTYVNYEADTPGFSFFAIGSKAAASAELQAILDMIDSFYATGSPTLLKILDSIDAYYSADGG